MIFELIDDILPDDDDSSSSPNFYGPSEAEIAAQQAKFAQFYHDLMNGNLEDNSGPYKLRSIVEGDCWWVPTKDDKTFELLNVKKGELKRLIAGITKSDGRRTNREGQGGQYVQVYCQKPNTPAKQFNGRQLARVLPKNVAGLVIKGINGTNDDDKPLELSVEFFDELRTLASAVELEDALLADGPIDAKVLLKAKWLVVTYNDYLCERFFILGAHGCTAATHEDKLVEDDPEIVIKHMTGKELFQRVLDTPELDGIDVNRCEFGRNGKVCKDMLLAPSFLHRALEGGQCHLRVKEYVVRSQEEFELWLELNDFPREREILEDTTADGQMTIKARSTRPVSDWRVQEVDHTQNTDLIVETPPFIIRTASPGDGFGQLASEVLCPGLLARYLYKSPPKKRKDSQHNWKPGKFMLVGTALSYEDIKEAKKRIQLAHELLKLIPVGESKVPRHALLTVLGASFAKGKPVAMTREWIEGCIVQSEKYCSKWVWGSP